MNDQMFSNRVLSLRAAAKRLQIPERTLRYRASRGWIVGAFKQGKLWKFPVPALESARSPQRVHLLAIALLLLYGLACAPSHSASRTDHLKPMAQRKPAPDFALQDPDGKTVRLSDYNGKVVLLDFWATWCGPCKIEEPWLKEFERSYKDKGFAILAVSMDEEGWSVVKPYIQERKINYRVLMGTPQIEELFGSMEAWPYTYLLDRMGRLTWTHVGVAPKKEFEDSIQTLLAE